MKGRTNTLAKTDSTIKSVHKALDIIDCISACPQGITVTELSERLSINKSTISKMLATLEMHGYVQLDSKNRRYKLGFSVLRLSTQVTKHCEVFSVAEDFLLDLRDKTGETVNFALYNNHSLTYVATYEGSYPVHLSSTAGMQASLTESAVGKAMLAFLHEPDRSDILRSLRGDPTCDLTNIDRDIENTRSRGYSINCDELTPGVSGVGAPVFDYAQKMVAAVAVAGLSARLDRTMLDAYGQLLVQTTRTISRQLGYPWETV